jgi:hypothetical protein
MGLLQDRALHQALRGGGIVAGKHGCILFFFLQFAYYSCLSQSSTLRGGIVAKVEGVSPLTMLFLATT